MTTEAVAYDNANTMTNAEMANSSIRFEAM